MIKVNISNVEEYMSINLKNIQPDDNTKKDIINQIKEYVKSFYGEISFNLINGDNGLIKVYESNLKTYVEGVKKEFINYFISELPNFINMKTDKENSEISFSANDKNIITLTHRNNLIFLNFVLDDNIKKEFNLSINSNFKKPEGFCEEKKENGFGRIIRFDGWAIEDLEKINYDRLIKALNEIKETCEFDNQIISSIDFSIMVYENIVNKHDELIINSKSIGDIIKHLCEKYL